MARLPFKFYEFFAGGGMVRAGLGAHWTCLFANDFDAKKGVTYQENWGKNELIVDDVRNIDPAELPDHADLIWGSFPCQDLSLAGVGAGLKGNRSGTFWPFMAIISELKAQGKAPKIIALENVIGTLTSHKGTDFVAICETLHKLGYACGALVVDAALFIPQSRPRLFIIAVQGATQRAVKAGAAQLPFHTPALQRAHALLPSNVQKNWIWWQLPKPPARALNLSDIIEENPSSVKWHSARETRNLLSMMSDINLAKVETAKLSGVKMVGGVYKRTRLHHGIKVQRAEVRFDNLAGCLRTPSGGSSRQLILIVEGETIRSRLISARETARLMGLPDTYALPVGYNEAYHLTGDGVAVPVVRHISQHLLEPLIAHTKKQSQRSAV